MKKRYILIFFIVLFFISLYFDNSIVKSVSEIRMNFLDDFFLGITFWSSEIIIFFFLTSLFLWQEHKRRWIFPLWLTLSISTFVCFILKYSIHRLRPYQLNLVDTLTILQEKSHLIWSFSFPSMHSLIAFCAVPILSKEFPKFKYIWILFASLIAFSRVYFGLHFLSDVIAGGIIGYLIGFIIVEFEKKKKFGERIYSYFFKKY